jgi:hypothetical protein
MGLRAALDRRAPGTLRPDVPRASMDTMSPPAQTQWYLARDGQQYGPLSEAELIKFSELGHLQPTDLLWREGFPDWRPAIVVFPPRKASLQQRHVPPPRSAGAAAVRAGHGGVAPQTARAMHAPQGIASGSRRSTGRQPQPSDDDGAPPRRRGLRRLLVVVFVLACLGGGGWYAHANREMLLKLLDQHAPWVLSSLSGLVASGGTGEQRDLDTSPMLGFQAAPDNLDATLQAAPLWRVLKREFPEWYADRLKEISALAGQSKDDLAIGQEVARALVALRRQQVSSALAAGLPRLKAVAATFHANLIQLKKHSSEACYEFISKGETGPLVVSLMQDPKYTPQLQAQMLAVFEAVAEGRKTGRAYPPPRQGDYDALASDLAKLGWSQADLQLFSDERALARAGPDKVCQLVGDWFSAQLGMRDPDMQVRLLADSLKPIIAG